jgi:hypothetical protein
VWPDRFVLQTDLTPVRWLAPRLRAWGHGIGTPVASLVPDGFQEYARVLHEIREEASGAKSSWAAVTQWSGRIYHPLMQFDLVANPVADDAPNVPFTRPRVGHLEERCRPLYEVLARWSVTDECWVGIWEGHGSLSFPVSMGFFSSGSKRRRGRGFRRVGSRRERLERDTIEMHGDLARGWFDVAHRVASAPTFELPGRAYLLVRAPLSAVCECESELQAAANLVWPDDCSWCVATEIDFDSTLVGGPQGLVDALREDTRLEVVKVRPEDRLDALGDRINAP